MQVKYNNIDLYVFSVGEEASINYLLIFHWKYVCMNIFYTNYYVKSFDHLDEAFNIYFVVINLINVVIRVS